MSGYDENTGVFELNWSKIERYISHRFPNEIPDEIESVVERLIRESKHTYLGKLPYGFKLVANDAQVWELLANKPATFGQTKEDPEKIYEKWKATREWFNATDLGKEFNPKLSAIKINRKLESLGFISSKDGGWTPTKLSLDKMMVRERGTANIYGNKPCVELSHKLIPVLADELLK